MSKLSSTSSLVLLWAGQECYKSKKAKAFLDQLELEEGKSLYEQCEKVCPYYDEVIKNRKFGIFNLIKKSIFTENNMLQIVIAAAGLDALGIELIEHYPNTMVYELDSKNMEFKSKLYGSIETKLKPNIVFIEADLLNTSSVYKSLSAHGWDVMKPTLLIIEGISYYLPTESIQNLFQTIKPNRTIFEFLKEDKEIVADKLKIAKKVFDLISGQCELSDITQYKYSKIEKLSNNMTIVDRHSMKRLEKMRTGSNRFFLTENSGWIEVCLLANKGLMEPN
ncbi:MAG: class I SAM-dependent methyltransferase [Nitrosomonadaceae bacterium]